MRETMHVFFSFLLAVLLVPFVGWNAIIVLLSATLVDFDHLLWYYMEFRDLSFKRCKSYTARLAQQKKTRQYRYPMNIFHTWELLVVLAILTLFFDWVLYLLIGVSFHLLLDTVGRLRFSGHLGLYSAVLFWVRRKAGDKAIE